MTDNAGGGVVNIEFVAGFAVITSDTAASEALYAGGLGMALEGEGYRSTESLPGVRHFGVWPLAAAAEACFGSAEWPTNVTPPQATIEFELGTEAEVAAGAAELAAEGFSLLHDSRVEPWGQTVARVLSPEGLVVGITYTPWFHVAGDT